MKKTPLLTALALAALTCAAGAAHSAIVTVENIRANWINPQPNVTITNNVAQTAARARWGTPAGGAGQSGYNFDVEVQPIEFEVPPSPSDTNVIGKFTHVNFPITGTTLESITLQITADVFVDGIEVGTDLNFNYGFSHDETPNNANPCAYGGGNNQGPNINGCADRVIATWSASSDDFEIDTDTGTDTYTLNVLGFSLDAAGTDPFNQFLTKESANNVAYLVGNVTLRSELDPEEIPEPTTLALAGLALAGIAASRRRKSSRA